MISTEEPKLPSFETKEQLWELIAEALDDPDEGVMMTPEEWDRLRDELAKPEHTQKLAS